MTQTEELNAQNVNEKHSTLCPADNITDYAETNNLPSWYQHNDELNRRLSEYGKRFDNSVGFWEKFAELEGDIISSDFDDISSDEEREFLTSYYSYSLGNLLIKHYFGLSRWVEDPENSNPTLLYDDGIEIYVVDLYDLMSDVIDNIFSFGLGRVFYHLFQSGIFKEK